MKLRLRSLRLRRTDRPEENPSLSLNTTVMIEQNVKNTVKEMMSRRQSRCKKYQDPSVRRRLWIPLHSTPLTRVKVFKLENLHTEHLSPIIYRHNRMKQNEHIRKHLLEKSLDAVIDEAKKEMVMEKMEYDLGNDYVQMNLRNGHRVAKESQEMKKLDTSHEELFLIERHSMNDDL
jgi:hypothetical protein